MTFFIFAIFGMTEEEYPKLVDVKTFEFSRVEVLSIVLEWTFSFEGKIEKGQAGVDINWKDALFDLGKKSAAARFYDMLTTAFVERFIGRCPSFFEIGMWSITRKKYPWEKEVPWNKQCKLFTETDSTPIEKRPIPDIAVFDYGDEELLKKVVLSWDRRILRELVRRQWMELLANKRRDSPLSILLENENTALMRADGLCEMEYYTDYAGLSELDVKRLGSVLHVRNVPSLYDSKFLEFVKRWETHLKDVF